MNKKKRIKDDPTWRSLLNLAGFALIVTFWQGFADRVCNLAIMPQNWTQSTKDVSDFLLISAVMLFTMLGCFAQHDKVKNQVSWIERSIWPFFLGWSFCGLYFALILFSSPAWPTQLLKLR